MSRVYLDWNATAPLRPEARAAMVAAMDVVGNPSSVHAEGRAAKALVERARAQVAAAVGCKPVEVVFTSGATEAAGVLAAAARHGGVCVEPTAHDALWAHFDLTLGETGPNTLAMGLVNSETGIITEPPERVDGLWPYGARRAGSLLLDATQAVGRIPWSFAWSGADMAILSAHKLGGPKGVGALILRDGLDIEAFQRGGGQEMGRRSGTENVVGIAGFGAAAEAAMAELAAGRWDDVQKLRNILETTLASDAKETIFVGNDLAAPAEHLVFCLSRLERRDAGDADGPCRFRHQRRLGLFQRQGEIGQPRSASPWVYDDRGGGPRRSGSRWGRRRPKTRYCGLPRRHGCGNMNTVDGNTAANGRREERKTDHAMTALDRERQGKGSTRKRSMPSNRFRANTSMAGTPISRWITRPRA